MRKILYTNHPETLKKLRESQNIQSDKIINIFKIFVAGGGLLLLVKLIFG